MVGRECMPIKILSLLNGDLEDSFCRALVGKEKIEYFRARRPADCQWPAALLNRHFWSQISAEAFDVVVFELDSGATGQLKHELGQRTRVGYSVEPIWSQLPAASAAVLIFMDALPRGICPGA